MSFKHFDKILSKLSLKNTSPSLILMIISPLIMQRLHTVYPTDIYSRTFNVAPDE